MRLRFGCLPLFALAAAAAQECRLIPLSPAQPAARIQEGEPAAESQTFRTNAFALSPQGAPHYFDSVNRIRRIEANGRAVTIAGNGVVADQVTEGPAREAGLPNVTQIAFSPQGELFFLAGNRVYRVRDGQVSAFAGSGRAGFNGEEGEATRLNLGGIVYMAFAYDGSLLIVDGYARVRRVDADGRMLRTVAGSTRFAAAAGLTGDEGPATEAALSNPRQVFPFRDGSFWIRDLGGRHIRIVTPDGKIDTVNASFDTGISMLPLPDGRPAAITANRVYPINNDGNLETGARPFTPFTGTPLGVNAANALFFLGNARPNLNNPLVKLEGIRQTVVGGAPAAALVDGQAAPFGAWRNGSLLYSSAVGNKSGIVEARPGQTPRLIAGGGEDVGDVDGKQASAVAIFGIVAFAVDGAGRVVVADVYRRRILVIGTDGRIEVLKANGQPVVYAPVGTLSTLQRITADAAGNIYWFQDGAAPTGGAFQATVAVWTRSSGAITTVPVEGLNGLMQLSDGRAVALAGNGANFRSVYPISPSGLGAPLTEFRMLPLGSVAVDGDARYFTAATRLFRGLPGSIEMLNLLEILPGSGRTPDFVLNGGGALLVHLTDGGFYRLENRGACPWIPQPKINAVVNAASGEFLNAVAPRQLLRVSGTGLGPEEGLGIVLDGQLRATGQQAPYPALVLGNFSGTIPQATLTGTTLPSIESSGQSVTVQAPATLTTPGTQLLYFTWQGLQLTYASQLQARSGAPGLFTANGGRDGLLEARNEDGSLHSVNNPAAAGSLVDLFGTGFGTVAGNPALGSFFGGEGNLPAVTNAVRVQIGGLPAELVAATGAPQRISGVYRLRVRIPEGLEPGEHLVVVEMNGAPGPFAQQVTISVQ
jgi:uncharacterized protein (TIGR03437 family)